MVLRLRSWCESNIYMNIPREGGTGMLEISNIFQLKIDHIFLGLTLIFGITPSKAGYSASIYIYISQKTTRVVKSCPPFCI